MIALKYNAFSMSCHLKGVKAVVTFIVALIVAEILSKLLIIFLLSSFFSDYPTTSETETCSTEKMIVATDSLTIMQKTEIITKAFEQGDFKAITVFFDTKMKEKLSSNHLRMAWMQTNFTCGKFEKADIESVKETQIEKYDVIEVPFFFRKKNRNLRLVFNSDGEISGLFFLPVN